MKVQEEAGLLWGSEQLHLSWLATSLVCHLSPPGAGVTPLSKQKASEELHCCKRVAFKAPDKRQVNDVPIDCGREHRCLLRIPFPSPIKQIFQTFSHLVHTGGDLCKSEEDWSTQWSGGGLYRVVDLQAGAGLLICHPSKGATPHEHFRWLPGLASPAFTIQHIELDQLPGTGASIFLPTVRKTSPYCPQHRILPSPLATLSLLKDRAVLWGQR